MADETEVWVLTLQPLPGPTPPAVRMRHLLKRLLRDYGMRCVRVSGTDPTVGMIPTVDEQHQATSAGVTTVQGDELIPTVGAGGQIPAMMSGNLGMVGGAHPTPGGEGGTGIPNPLPETVDGVGVSSLPSVGRRVIQSAAGVAAHQGADAPAREGRPLVDPVLYTLGGSPDARRGKAREEGPAGVVRLHRLPGRAGANGEDVAEAADPHRPLPPLPGV